MATPTPLQQLCLVSGPSSGAPTSASASAFASLDADGSSYAREYDQALKHLLPLCPEPLWPKDSHKTWCPRPILVTEQHQRQLEDLHEALTLALTDIVERWWSDAAARFPSRMPLEPREEELLQWLDSQVLKGTLRRFSECRGSWRPDFLVGQCAGAGGEGGDLADGEDFILTEINARFSFNGTMYIALGQEALDSMGLGSAALQSATKSDTIFDGLLSLFQPDLPLHLLKGEEAGMDIHIFRHMMQQRYGITPRLIKPSDLRLVADAQSASGFKLCCVAAAEAEAEAEAGETWVTADGERVEEVRQVGLELHQRELLAMDGETLRQVGLRCFNDLRTVLLVHDKRMLGIVRQELGGLEARGVLTAAQAATLRRGIPETLVPGSSEMGALLRRSRADAGLRRQFLLKPVRSGKGAGIVFGDETTQEEWLAALEGLGSAAAAAPHPGQTRIVQRQVAPRLYDMVMRPGEGRARYPLVGTYHVAQGRLLGLGIWRSNGDRICAVSGGGSWMCSVRERQGM
ncbi:uncharacterized protein UV8b_03572 [Ustilaginoidea virens]|uniref:Taurine catabolism dioxygenase TauD n=1 Tax=Ustilaginoidea virens TaxID=1159556 RepID=A0A8E5HPR0_USTVR|nr:uncharacterized protein UV8b_03572 [Ustilaginoidea virens]QUC19331.1 hypothetical protein UV8b_03572 [Ustilaginoidea virens]